jgi:hypothetical protein
MSDTRLIAVDSGTATVLERHAAERGTTVAQIVAELLPATVGGDALVDLQRRWEAVEGGAATVPHEEVARWLKTWGTAEFKAWDDR